MPGPQSALAWSRSLGQSDFDHAVSLHEKYLKRSGGERAILQFIQARAVDCRRRLLNDADLTGADLQNSLFTGSHFERAALYCANLEGCDLRASNLKRADLRGAKLAGAALNGAVMEEADMRAARIVHAHDDDGLSLRRSRSGPGDGATQSFGADFTNCAMRGARLCAANLKGANFTGALLDSADFSGAKLTEANFSDTVLTSAVLDRLNLTPEQLSGCLLDPDAEAIGLVPALLARLRSAAEWVDSDGARGAPACLDAEDLRPLAGALRARQLTALTARGSRGIYTDWSGSKLQGANFDRADLRGAVFDGADLRGASFRDAKLSHARFTGADLSPLVLPSGQARGVDFTGATMDRVEIT